MPPNNIAYAIAYLLLVLEKMSVVPHYPFLWEHSCAMACRLKRRFIPNLPPP